MKKFSFIVAVLTAVMLTGCNKNEPLSRRRDTSAGSCTSGRGKDRNDSIHIMGSGGECRVLFIFH